MVDYKISIRIIRCLNITIIYQILGHRNTNFISHIFGLIYQWIDTTSLYFLVSWEFR